MERDYLSELHAAFVGCECTVQRAPPEWLLAFGDGPKLFFPFPWRIVANHRVAFASEDDGQWFGLPSPLDGETRANELLSGRRVEAMRINHQTGDLCISFEGDVQAEAFTASSGYEGWRAYYEAKSGRWGIILLGGGEIAVVPD